ncbi:MAG: 30S ribosomal protein S17 [Candidatus Dependentiae bacterium]|nr:30S ribosomal protein S17 [Candidatus Dependentiae bacterium]
MEKKEQTQKRVFVGEVLSDKMDKTIVVEIVRTYTHPVFHKTMHKVKKYKVHDENGQANVGDIVEFYEGRPVSKTKYMYLARVVQARAVNQ